MAVELVPILVALLGTVFGALLSYKFENSIGKRDIGICLSVAGGMMLGCSFVLFWESIKLSSFTNGLFSVMFGAALMKALECITDQVLDVDNFAFSNLKGNRAKRLFVMFTGLLLHSLGEGISLGLAAISSNSSVPASTASAGVMVYVSLAIHNVPETAALALAFRAKGVSKLHALSLAILCSVPQTLVALSCSSLYLLNFAWLVFGVGVAAGCMVYAVCKDLLPEAFALTGTPKLVLSISLLTGAIVVLVDLYSDIHIR